MILYLLAIVVIVSLHVFHVVWLSNVLFLLASILKTCSFFLFNSNSNSIVTLLSYGKNSQEKDFANLLTLVDINE